MSALVPVAKKSANLTTVNAKICPSCQWCQEDYDVAKCEICGFDFVLGVSRKFRDSDKIGRFSDDLDLKADPTAAPTDKERNEEKGSPRPAEDSRRRRRHSRRSRKSRRSRDSRRHRSHRSGGRRHSSRSRHAESRRSRREREYAAGMAASGWGAAGGSLSYQGAHPSQLDPETLATMPPDVQMQMMMTSLKELQAENEYLSQMTYTRTGRRRAAMGNKVKVIDLDNLGQEEKKCVVS